MYNKNGINGHASRKRKPDRNNPIETNGTIKTEPIAMWKGGSSSFFIVQVA